MPQATAGFNGRDLGVTIRALNFEFLILNFELPLGHV